MSTELQPQAKKPQRMALSAVFATKEFQSAIHNALNDVAREKKFVASIVAASTINPALQECTPKSVLSVALIGESLNLLPSPQLGQYYFVPYEVTVKGPDGKNVPLLDESGRQVMKNGYPQFKKIKKAQFQIGYKGYIQLALRSGYYKKIVVISIKEGELISWDPLFEDLKINMILDDDERASRSTVGYYAFFECLNGFTKGIYWSKQKMVNHADRYSPAFSKNPVVNKKDPKYNKVSFADFEAGKVANGDLWLYSSFWYKDFDAMAFKTMLRQLISKWGPLSVDLQEAIDKDVISEQEEEVLHDGYDAPDGGDDPEDIIPDATDVDYQDVPDDAPTGDPGADDDNGIPAGAVVDKKTGELKLSDL